MCYKCAAARVRVVAAGADLQRKVRTSQGSAPLESGGTVGKAMVTDSATENTPPVRVRLKWWSKSPPRRWQQRRHGKPRVMQDKQGEGRLPATRPPGISRTLPCRARPHGREKNGHTARKGGQNPAYRTREAISIPASPHTAELRGAVRQQRQHMLSVR